MSTRTRVVAVAAACLLLAGAVGWGASNAQDSQRSGEIAVVDVVGLLEQALQTTEYSEPRDALYQEIEDDLASKQNALMELQQRLQTMPQDDPGRNELLVQFQVQQAGLQQASQDQSARYDQLSVSQAEGIYAEIYEAARKVARQRGYTYVLSSRTPEGELTGQFNLSGAAQQILARPLLVGAEGNDLTPDVRKELGLPEPGAEATPADGQGAADDATGGAADSEE